MTNNIKIKELKAKFNAFGVVTDRDMFEKLGITNDEDKRMIFAWINYQSAFAYRDGFNDGQDRLRERLIKVKNKINKIFEKNRLI